MKDQEILSKVPEGNFKSVLIQHHAITWGPTDYRSLADIKRIVELEELVKEAFEEGYYEGVHFPSPLNCKWDESWAKRDLAILKEQVK
jgi:hypothetical protein